MTSPSVVATEPLSRKWARIDHRDPPRVRSVVKLTVSSMYSHVSASQMNFEWVDAGSSIYLVRCKFTDGFVCM